MIDLIRSIRSLLSPRERLLGLGLLAMMLVGALLEMVGVAAIPALVSVLLNPDVLRAYGVGRWVLNGVEARGPTSVVALSAGALFAFFLLKNAYLFLLRTREARYVYALQARLEQRLFSAYLYSPYPFHLQRNSADLLRNVSDDAARVVSGGLLPLLQLSMEFLTVTATLVLLFAVEPMTSLMAFVVLGGSTGLFLKGMRGRMLRLGERDWALRAERIRTVQEGLGGVKVTKALNRERHFADRLREVSSTAVEVSVHRQVYQEAPRLVLEVLAVGGLLVVAGGLLAQGRSIDALIPVLSLLGVAVVRMVPSFNKITSALNNLRYGRQAIQTVHRDFTELTPDLHDGESEPALTFDRDIRVANVSFRYPGARRPSLDGVSLVIRKGEAVAFVGPTGAGKTTLVDLLLGLLEPTEGSVLVDGVDIRGRDRAWRRCVGYVPQDVYLCDATIRENVAFGVPSVAIDEGAVGEAIRAAQLEGLVASLPDGLDTTVGERGVRLSGGQRQRIGIARALYHRPSVLLMDEATSSLDNETERFVMEAIEQFRGQCTLLIIAHRLTTVRSCDRLFYFRDGRLEEEGSYDDLIGEGSAFRTMATA